jgi:hypothetical protein
MVLLFGRHADPLTVCGFQHCLAAVHSSVGLEQVHACLIQLHLGFRRLALEESQSQSKFRKRVVQAPPWPPGGRLRPQLLFEDPGSAGSQLVFFWHFDMILAFLQSRKTNSRVYGKELAQQTIGSLFITAGGSCS